MRRYLKITIILIVCAVILFSIYFGIGYKSFKEKGMWQDFPGIFTAYEPQDLKLYRQILPKEFGMPDRPIAALFVVDYVKVVPLPMTPYLEAMVALSCKYEGEETWHVVTMPVTSRVACAGGRSLGFPKYVADRIVLENNGDNWEGIVIHEDITRMKLEFTPGLTRELTPYEKEFLDGRASRLEAPIYQLVPPGIGPGIYRIHMKEVVSSRWEKKAGMVKMTISHDVPWSGLIPPGTVSPGVYQRFTGGNRMMSNKVL
jgi:hypothetical protein